MGESVKSRKPNAQIIETETSSTSFSGTNTEIISSVDFELRNHSISLKEDDVSLETSSLYDRDVREQSCSFSSVCSSNEACEIGSARLGVVVDLEAKSFETEISTCINNKFRERNLSRDIHGGSEEMNSTLKNPTTQPRIEVKKSDSRMLTQTEIDDFFEEAEKYDQKQYTEKYNYDFGKDLPLEGRYQWVLIKP